MTIRSALLDVVLSFSRALDLLHPAIADHHLRVAYLSATLSETMGLGPESVQDGLIAGALHDVGTVSSPHMLSVLDQALADYRLEGGGPGAEIHAHGEEGYQLIRHFPPFARAAEAIRHHHVNWAFGAGARFGGRRVTLASHILHLADRVAVLPVADGNILGQVSRIREIIERDADRRFRPDVVEAFGRAADREAFWLDLVESGKGRIIRERFGDRTVGLDLEALEQLAHLFARVIDYRSPYTATHSTGVAITAEALGRRLGMSSDECRLLRVAGYLHDIGKLAVPIEILDKPGPLTPGEMQRVKQHAYHTHRILSGIPGLEQITAWAALHHERLDGRGYPFRPATLPLGARIVAVADIYTAITEDRPYRRGMEHREAFAVLSQAVQCGALDGRVVAALAAETDGAQQPRTAAG